MKTALTKTTILASLLVVASAWMISCSGDKGDTGAAGAAGANGAGCTAASNANGVTITCGSDVYTLTNGEKGEKGEGACTATTGSHPETGVPSIIINCGNGPQYVAQGGSGSASGIDCELITDTDMTGASTVATGQGAKGPRQIFGIKCGNGSEVRIGFCGQYNDVWNPKTEKCVETTIGAGDWHIVPGIGRCKTAAGIVEYVMSEQFCQDAEGTSANDEGLDDDDKGIGTVLKPICAGDSYDAYHFCYGYEAGKSAGIITSKCGTSVLSPEFEVWEFCLFKYGSPNNTYVKTPRCGMSATNLPSAAMINGTGIYATGIVGNNTKWTGSIPTSQADVAGFNGAGKYNETEFCQAETNLVLSLCGGLTYTKDETCLPENQIGGLCGRESYNTSRSFCAAQDTKVYALCGSTSAAGMFDPTQKFCWSGDFSSTDTDSANAYGIIKDLCHKSTYVPANSSSSAVDPEMVGYYTNQFCSAQDGKITPLCGQKEAYNTNDYSCTLAGTQYNVGSSSSAATTNVLSGKCTDGNTTSLYNINELSCSTNKVYRACYGGSESTALPQAYDGPALGQTVNAGGDVVSVGYVGTASQTCATPTSPTSGPAVRCATATPALITKTNVVGCICNIEADPTKPFWNGTACAACTNATDVWDPQANGGRGKCELVTTGCPVNSTANTNNICVCTSGSWKTATQNDVNNTSDAIYTAVLAVGQSFCH